MENKLEEIKFIKLSIEEIRVSLDLLHQRFDRLFYWTGYLQQESQISRAHSNAHGGQLVHSPKIREKQNKSPPTEADADSEVELLSRLATLKTNDL